MSAQGRGCLWACTLSRSPASLPYGKILTECCGHNGPSTPTLPQTSRGRACFTRLSHGAPPRAPLLEALDSGHCQTGEARGAVGLAPKEQVPGWAGGKKQCSPAPSSVSQAIPLLLAAGAERLGHCSTETCHDGAVTQGLCCGGSRSRGSAVRLPEAPANLLGASIEQGGSSFPALWPLMQDHHCRELAPVGSSEEATSPNQRGLLITQ